MKKKGERWYFVLFAIYPNRDQEGEEGERERRKADGDLNERSNNRPSTYIIRMATRQIASRFSPSGRGMRGN